MTPGRPAGPVPEAEPPSGVARAPGGGSGVEGEPAHLGASIGIRLP